MAQITWRNVAAPDFGTALQGTQQFSNLFGRATEGLASGLDTFDRAQTSQAASAILNQALQIQDPAAYKAALQSGQLTAGVDPRRLTPGLLKELDGRSTALIDQAARGLDFEKGTYNFGRQKDENVTSDAARPAVNDIMMRAAGGDRAGMLAAIENNRGVLSQIKPEDLSTAVTGGQRAIGTDTNNLSAANTLAMSVRGDTESREAESKAMDIIRSNPLGIDGARDMFNKLDLPQAIRGKVRGLLATHYGEDPYAAIGGNGAGGGGGGVTGAISGATGGGGSLGAGAAGTFAVAPGTAGFGTKSGSAYDRTVGDVPTPKPITDMTFAEVKDFGDKVLKPGNAGKYGNPAGVGSSAMGAWQITGQTLDQYAPKAIGADWQNQKMTPANQDKIAEAIFNDRKGGNLKATWTSLPDATPGAYKDMSWEQAKKIIGPGESGGVPGAAIPDGTPEAKLNAQQEAQRAQLGTALTGQRVSENRANDISARIRKVAGDDSFPDEVAAKLAELPAYKGTKVGTLVDMINTVRQESGMRLSPAEAGAIVQSSQKFGRNLVFPNSWSNRTEQNTELDMDLVRTNVKNAIEGKQTVNAVKDDVHLVNAKNYEVAAQLAVQTQQRFMALQQRAQVDPAAAAGLDTARRELARVNANLALAKATAEGSLAQTLPTKMIEAGKAARDAAAPANPGPPVQRTASGAIAAAVGSSVSMDQVHTRGSD